MKKTVYKDLRTLSFSTLCRMMDDCLPAEIEDVSDMLKLIQRLWPALLAEQECDENSISDFLEEHSPVYDNWQMIDDEYCCEKSILRDRERLFEVAKG